MTSTYSKTILTILAVSTLSFANGAHGPGRSYAPSKPKTPPAAATEARRIRAAAAYHRIPLTFEVARGNARQGSEFVARGRNYAISLTPTGATLSFRGIAGGKKSDPKASPAAFDWGSVRIKILGEEAGRTLSGTEKLRGKATYFLGNDRSKWLRNVPLYGKVREAKIYPGIDLLYYGNQQKLECDFVLAPGADPGNIRFSVTGTSGSSSGSKKRLLKIDPRGNLVIETGLGELRFRKPVVYQLERPIEGTENLSGRSGGERQNTIGAGSLPLPERKYLGGRFELIAKNEVAFTVTSYDRSKPLVIDPVLSYSSYLGGSDLEQINAIAIDSTGMAYVTGWTVSTGFPLAGTPYQNACNHCDSGANYWDVFVSKFDPTQSGVASLIYSTYLGGTDQDAGNGVAVDSAGDVFITGVTYSSDFPLSASPYSLSYGGAGDAFVSKLGPAGSTLPYSSYFGSFKLDEGLAIALGGPDQPFITGSTCSSGLAVAGAFQGTLAVCPAAFVAVFNTAASGSASLTYSSYLAGTSGSQQGNAIAVDQHGNALVAGQTTSPNFPVTAGAFDTSCGTDAKCDTGLYSDAFVSVLTPNATVTPAANQLVYSTFLGGGNADVANAIAAGSSGYVYIAGLTKSADFPTTRGAYQVSEPGGSGTHAFVAKLNPDRSLYPPSLQLVFSTYLGGSGYEQANAIAVDGADQAYVSGYTDSTDFPLASPIVTQCSGCPGAIDGFVTKFNASASALIFSSYLGGSQEDNATGIAVDSSGNAFVGGFTYSSDFPVSPSAFLNSNSGQDDGFFVKLSDLTLPVATVSPTSLSFPDTDVTVTSAAMTATLTNDGDADLTLTTSTAHPDSVYTTGDFAVDSSGTTCTTNLTLPPGSNCTISVTFTPTMADDRSGEIDIQDNAYESPQTVTLKGKGLSLATVSVSPTSLDFGDQRTGSSSKSQQVTLSNTGSGPLDISGITTSLSDYSQTNSCGTQVPAGDSCDITVSFSPSSSGAITGTLTVNDDGPDNPHEIGLSGTGISILLSAPSLAFADQQVGTNSDPQTVNLTNSGTEAATISSISTTGDFSQTNDCPAKPATLAPSATCSLSITFTPTAAGPLQGSAQIFDETDGVPQTITLSGNGVQPTVAFSPASIDFGSIVVGQTSPPQTSTLTNGSQVALTISSIAASGDFGQTNDCPLSPDTLAAGASCTLTVTFTPSATDVRRGSVTVTDDASGSPQSLSLTGIGSAPEVTLSPSSLTFSAQGVNTTSTAQTAIMTNSGSVPLTISSIAASGDFGQTNDCPISPDTLAVGARCTLTVTFTPSVTDVRRGSVTVTDDASGSPQVLSLSGTGEPAFSIGSSSLSETILKGTDSTNFQISASTSFGFTGNISLSCSGNSPAVCSFAPASITPGQSSTLTLSGLSAFTTSFLQFTVRAVSGTQAASLDLTALISDFTISSTPPSASISAGQSEDYTITLSPVNGYDRTISLACSVSPPGTACSVSPSSLVLDGTNPATAQMTISTVAPSLAPPGSRTPPPAPGPASWTFISLLLALMLVGAVVGVHRTRRGLSWRVQFALSLALLIVLSWTACGGGQAELPQTGNGTAPMTYTVTLTGTSGSVTHSATATLTVN